MTLGLCQNNFINCPQFGVTEPPSQKSVRDGLYFNEFSKKKVILFISREIFEDLRAVDLELSSGRPGACLTIYTPYENQGNRTKRYFKNGEVDRITTNYKIIYLENFTVGSVRFVDSVGLTIKGYVIMDKKSKITDPDNTLARVIQLRDKNIQSDAKDQ